MDRKTRSSLSFISGEVSGTLNSKKNQSIKSTDDQKRLKGGSDDKTSSYSINGSNKMPEIHSFCTNGAGNRARQSRYSSQDSQTRENICAIESVRAVAGSDLLDIVFPSGVSLSNKEEGGESSMNKKKSSDNEPEICFCGSSEKKIDEMMEYAIQNISEADKALTNLGDNFEHDLKLMFMDIMGRVQHWVNVVENRIYAAKADLESIRNVYIAYESNKSSTKDLELITVRKKLADAEASLVKLRKEYLEMKKNDSDRRSQSVLQSVSNSAQTDIEKDEELSQNESIVSFMNTGCQCGEDDRENTPNREAELETELAQVLEENERILKEREEYEKAIHCALLKGVSSLNIEALKVLRYPPIPCFNPCGGLSPSSDSPEPIMPYHQRTVRCDGVAPQPVKRGSSKNEKTDKIRSKKSTTNANCCQQLSEDLGYSNGERNGKRSAESNMLFLLHHGDDGNQCQPCLQTRYRANGTPDHKGSVCVGGKCKKSATIVSTKQKIPNVTRSPGSRPASYDVCVRSRDDSAENNNTAARKTNPLIKRCGVNNCCNGNRRNTEKNN